jgi:uncharacterized membrane protein
MQMSPMLFLHILGGTLGLVAGAAAMIFRKGSYRHRVAGIIFAISMLTLAGSGVYMALMKWQPGNILGGTLTFYLVMTAWMTVRARNAATKVINWSALLLVLGIFIVEINFGLQALASPKGTKEGVPAAAYFIFGTVAGLCAVGDIRVLVLGGIVGTKRLARHLWRMCFALFVASASVFLARAHLFPAIMRKSGMLTLLTVLPLMLMIFWLIRVRFANAYHRQRSPRVREGTAAAVPTGGD